jgi:hypothetical protein
MILSSLNQILGPKYGMSTLIKIFKIIHQKAKISVGDSQYKMGPPALHEFTTLLFKIFTVYMCRSKAMCSEGDLLTLVQGVST